MGIGGGYVGLELLVKIYKGGRGKEGKTPPFWTSFFIRTQKWEKSIEENKRMHGVRTYIDVNMWIEQYRQLFEGPHLIV